MFTRHRVSNRTLSTVPRLPPARILYRTGERNTRTPDRRRQVRRAAVISNEQSTPLEDCRQLNHSCLPGKVEIRSSLQ